MRLSDQRMADALPEIAADAPMRVHAMRMTDAPGGSCDGNEEWMSQGEYERIHGRAEPDGEWVQENGQTLYSKRNLEKEKKPSLVAALRPSNYERYSARLEAEKLWGEHMMSVGSSTRL